MTWLWHMTFYIWHMAINIHLTWKLFKKFATSFHLLYFWQKHPFITSKKCFYFWRTSCFFLPHVWVLFDYITILLLKLTKQILLIFLNSWFQHSNSTLINRKLDGKFLITLKSKMILISTKYSKGRIIINNI